MLKKPLDSKFIEYFRKKCPWTKHAPVTNFPWYVMAYRVWKECTKAYSVNFHEGLK